MFRVSFVLIVSGVLLFPGAVAFGGKKGSSDEFSGIHCGSDIVKALIGKRMSDEPVVVSEKKHQDLGLKHLGADIINDDMNCIWWLICGSEYMVLESKDIVRDVVKLPERSKKSPEFQGICEINGKKMDGEVTAILDNEKETGEKMLPAKVAWKIDEKKAKFVSVPVEGMLCPSDKVIERQ